MLLVTAHLERKFSLCSRHWELECSTYPLRAQQCRWPFLFGQDQVCRMGRVRVISSSCRGMVVVSRPREVRGLHVCCAWNCSGLNIRPWSEAESQIQYIRSRSLVHSTASHRTTQVLKPLRYKTTTPSRLQSHNRLLKQQQQQTNNFIQVQSNHRTYVTSLYSSASTSI